MRVLSIVHQAEGPTGVFADAVDAGGHELVEWRIADEPAPPGEPDAVVVLGGTMHVDQEERHGWLRDEKALLRRWLADRVPILGVCLGGQLLAEALHAPVRRLPSPEIGWSTVALTPEAEDDPIFAGLPVRFAALQWHSYAFELPERAVPLARNERCLQAYRVGEVAWGLQFHAEVRRKTLETWTEAAGNEGWIDPDRLRAESDDRIAAWNTLGTKLCTRFLAVAEARWLIGKCGAGGGVHDRA